MNSSKPEDPVFLKPSVAAKLLSVSYPTLKKMIKSGKVLSRLTEGGHHLIPVTEIERLQQIRQQPQQTTEDQSWVLDEEISVLVVEDTYDTQMLLKSFLEKKGFRVEIAVDFKTAVLSLCRQLPDIIVTDLISEKENRAIGIDLIRHIKSTPSWSDIPIIAISGYTGPNIQFEAEAILTGKTSSSESPYKIQALEAGAIRVLDKPDGYSELPDAIIQVLNEDLETA